MRLRWAIPGLMAMLLLSGCNREPSFDERYGDAEKSIKKKAAEIDAELVEAERLASEAAAVASASPAPQATSSMKAAK